jgi:hypothetical protein
MLAMAVLALVVAIALGGVSAAVAAVTPTGPGYPVPPTCGKRSDHKLPFCIKGAINDARKTAKLWHSLINAPCSAAALQAGGHAACLVNAAYNAVAATQSRQYLKLAKARSGGHYWLVARPRTAQVGGLASVAGFSPATYQLLRGYLEISGLVAAITTAQQRAEAAFAAVSAGKPSAAGAIAKQDKAEARYIKRALRLIRGQAGIASVAASELRHLASGVTGKSGIPVRRVFRAVATSFTSPAETMADRLAAAALKAIGG